MVDIKGSFKVLRPSEGKKIRVTVDLVTPSQVLARYRGIYEVVLTNDLSGSWLGLISTSVRRCLWLSKG